MPTIRDVARRAGVAPTTVSRVIHNKGYISEKTRTRVQQAIRELGYVPNILAQSLRYNKTDTVALVLSDITNPFWTTVARGVEDVCQLHNMNVFLCNTDEKQDKLDNYVNVLLQRQTDGFLLVPADDTTTTIERIQGQNVPIVVLDRPIANSNVDVVRSDSENGAYMLTNYLIEHGHRRIAIIAGPSQISTSSLRLKGYQRALSANHIPYDEKLVYHGHYNQEAGRNAKITHHIMHNIHPFPSVIFAGNNFIAIDVLQELYKMGYRVPDDISVVSFDDIPYTWHPQDFLTAVRQSPYQLGYQAATLLLSIIAGEEDSDQHDIVLPVEMVERQSCADLRQTS